MANTENAELPDASPGSAPLGCSATRRNNLIFEHPSDDVKSAAIRLLDALCMWERNTGRHHVLILKDSIGCEYRVLDNAPIPSDVTDQQLLEAFHNLEIGGLNDKGLR